jgi:hypothetical protein
VQVRPRVGATGSLSITMSGVHCEPVVTAPRTNFITTNTRMNFSEEQWQNKQVT